MTSSSAWTQELPELDEIAALARPLRRESDLDPLLDRIGDAHFVLLGEASHGTAEFYSWRAAITRRLVSELRFSFVAVEGDWPDCFAINRWLKDQAEIDQSPVELLHGFQRWPTWMWANHEVADFLAWLRAFNRETKRDVGFYGLDVYSLWDSMHVVIEYVAAQHPDAVQQAWDAYRCFEPYDEDPQRYAWASRMLPRSCEQEVVQLLMQVRARADPLGDDPDDELDVRQNAEVMVEAERYYRTMVRSDASSWNIRDCHMVDTLDRLVAHHGPGAKAIVWAHNTHVGDARATNMTTHGMVNIGQLARDRHGQDDVVLVGFAGHHGTVVAADAWDTPAAVKCVPDAPAGTHEYLLHQAVGAPALFRFADGGGGRWLSTTRGHRAIGVVYRPEQERRGNWVPTELGRRYDALVSFDNTTALHQIHAEPAGSSRERETFPTGR